MKHLGIITALLSEARCFINQPRIDEPLRVSDRISLVVSGIGQKAAAGAAQRLIDAGADSLLSTGMAGGLSDELHAGDLLLPRVVSTESGQKNNCDVAWHDFVLDGMTQRSMPLNCGELLSSRNLIVTSEEKAQIASTGAAAVDMESAAIMKIASTNQLPALVIRSVIDPSDFCIPDYILDNYNAYGEMNMLSLVRSVLARPGRISSLYRLGRYYKSAMSSLNWIGRNIDTVLMPAAGNDKLNKDH